MMFAIDFADTISCDVALFKDIVAAIKAHGHNAVAVTNMAMNDYVEKICTEELGISVVYCAGQMKSVATAAKGVAVDVWIDDYPRGI